MSEFAQPVAQYHDPLPKPLRARGPHVVLAETSGMLERVIRRDDPPSRSTPG